MTAQPIETTANPGPVMGLMAGYWQAKILLAAVEHDVFTRLSGNPATSAVVAADLGLVPRGLNDLLAGLSHLGLLESRDGTFGNTPTAETFLVKGRPEYLGGYLSFCAGELNPAWDGLATAL